MAEAKTKILDVDGAAFAKEVIEESHRRPVVVDFWAPWCGPCRALGPILERLAEEAGGAFLLAKVNVDDNQELAATYRIQGIPAVKAFRGGEEVDGFVGVLPEAQIRGWLEGLVPGPADELVSQGSAHEAAGEATKARAAFEQALELRPREAAALVALARLEIAAGNEAAAEHHLDLLIPDDSQAFRALEPEIARLRLQLQAGGADGLDELEAQVKAAPGDLGAKLRLGQALAVAGRHEDALALLLEIVRASPRVGEGEEARLAMLEIFNVVGPRSDLADRFRSMLATELYR